MIKPSLPSAVATRIRPALSFHTFAPRFALITTPQRDSIARRPLPLAILFQHCLLGSPCALYSRAGDGTTEGSVAAEGALVSPTPGFMLSRMIGVIPIVTVLPLGILCLLPSSFRY